MAGQHPAQAQQAGHGAALRVSKSVDTTRARMMGIMCTRDRVLRCALQPDRCAYAAPRFGFLQTRKVISLDPLIFMHFRVPRRRFGPLESVRVFPGKTFAFVNYLSPQVGRPPTPQIAARAPLQPPATPVLCRTPAPTPLAPLWPCVASGTADNPHHAPALRPTSRSTRWPPRWPSTASPRRP